MKQYHIKSNNAIIYNYGPHRRSTCGYMDPRQVTPTEDTESDIDRACEL